MFRRRRTEGRTGALHVDDARLLQRGSGLHRHVRPDQPAVARQRRQVEEGRRRQVRPRRRIAAALHAPRQQGFFLPVY